jgi:hypothetical protein
LEVASYIQPGAERDELLSHAITEWGLAGQSSEAMRWAQQIPDQALREKLLAALAVASAEAQGEAAAAMVATGLTPGPLQERTAVQVAQRWAQIAPEAAAEWVAGFPEGPIRSAAMASLEAIRRNVPLQLPESEPGE